MYSDVKYLNICIVVENTRYKSSTAEYVFKC